MYCGRGNVKYIFKVCMRLYLEVAVCGLDSICEEFAAFS